jgi:hypothetical protein
VTGEKLNPCGRRFRTGVSEGLAIFALLMLMAAPGLHAAPLGSSIMGMFPKNVSEFGYADLSAARQFSWFPQFEAQVVPVSMYSFEQFLEAAQMQQTPVIEGVAWARISSSTTNSGASGVEPGNGQLVGVAEGHFDRKAIQSFLGARKISGIQVGADLIYDAGTGSGVSDVFFILSSDQTIAFGSLAGLKRLLSTHAGDEENLLTNEKMIGLIDGVHGDGIFWGVFGAGRAETVVQQLLPDLAKFSQARDLIGKMEGVSIAVKDPSDIELDFQAMAASPNDALVLSQLFEAGLLYKQQQSIKSNSGLSQILDRARVSSNGVSLELSIDVDDDQVLSLIEHDTFALPM